MLQDQRLVPGAGAVEMALSKKINSYSTQFTGLEQVITNYAFFGRFFRNDLQLGVRETLSFSQISLSFPKIP